MSKPSTEACAENRKAQMDLQNKEIMETLRHIKNKILVMSGKGGVGKSSVTAYLSVSLANKGHHVGLMDVDLHGPSIPRILGLNKDFHLASHEGKMLPVRYLPNMQVISIETLMGENKDSATIWRGPLKIGAIRQFISDIEWMNLDYLVIDSPPGNGDKPLTVAQTIQDARALIVTTPQEVSLADVIKSINFCRRVNMEILGLVENMNGLTCPYCGETINVSKSKGGEATAKRENLRLLATLPLEVEVVREGDAGDLSILEKDELLIAREFNKMVDVIVKLTDPKASAPGQNDKKYLKTG